MRHRYECASVRGGETMRKRNVLVVSLAIALVALSVYNMQVSTSQYGMDLGVEIHVDMYHYRDGVLLSHSHHPGTLTTLGQNWIEDQLGDTPATDPAKWIGLSNDATGPSAAWIVLPAEITTNGLARAVGTYVDDGNGSWNITKTFSVTGTQSCQLTGLYWALAGDFLLCADTFTLVNAENGDSLEIVWSLSVT